MRKSLIKVLTSAIAVSALLLGGITPAFSIEGADSAAAEISAETPAAKTEQKPDSGAKAAGSVHETAGPQSERAAKSAADTANKAAEPKPETRNEKLKQLPCKITAMFLPSIPVSLTGISAVHSAITSAAPGIRR
ncbi:hypothetical protein RQN30_08775 [Arcanobacterium hippocoleae]